MPEVLLIQPPIQDFYLTAKRTLPYGLAVIAGALRRQGFSVGLLDGLSTDRSRVLPWPEDFAFLHPFYGRPDRSPFALFHHFRHFGYSMQHIAQQARASGAFLIGISSLFSAYSDMALQTAAAVKQVCPKAIVVLGGHHPSALPEAVLAHPAVDFVLRGEAEETLPLLARALKAGTSPEAIPGLAWRQPDGRPRLSPPVVVSDLDGLPEPAFDLLNWRFYRRSGLASVALTAGRGCPLRCTYCAVNQATYHGCRSRGIAAVLAELRAADRIAPLGFIDFEDENLSAQRSWFLDLLAAIEQAFGNRHPELRAMNGLYAPTLDREVIGRMQQAGFKSLNLALITTSAAQLKRFGRPDASADLDRVLDLGHSYGLSSVAYLIVAGPGQTPESSVADLLFLAQRQVLAGVSVFYPAPGSADYGWCARNGQLPSRFGLMRATTLPLADRTGRVQAVTLLRLGRLLNFMKSLLDAGRPLPRPRTGALDRIPQQTDRLSAGAVLLAAFLKDGNIRGLDDDGQVYLHQIDSGLTRSFLQGLARIQLRGAGQQF